MARMLHVARMREGREGELRGFLDGSGAEIDFGTTGLHEVSIFIGSGYCATLYDYHGEAKDVFAALQESRATSDFFGGLATYLDESPVPAPGEAAQFTLAGDAYRWPRRTETAEYRTVEGTTTTLDRQHAGEHL